MTISVIVYDLDDTLYDELDYVRSGMTATACYLAKRFDWSQSEVELLLMQSLEVSRDQVFDRVLNLKGQWSEDLIEECVSVYREHKPDIQLHPSTNSLLETYASRYTQYIVTDGHAGVQQTKLTTLGLMDSPHIKHCFVTYQLGSDFAKPSPRCFELIVSQEQCLPENVVYIADNPSKDFVGIKPLGYQTIRVLTGQHATSSPVQSYEADNVVQDLTSALSLVDRL